MKFPIQKYDFVVIDDPDVPSGVGTILSNMRQGYENQYFYLRYVNKENKTREWPFAVSQILGVYLPWWDDEGK